jgi:hypothetical protein
MIKKNKRVDLPVFLVVAIKIYLEKEKANNYLARMFNLVYLAKKKQPNQVLSINCLANTQIKKEVYFKRGHKIL